MVTIGNWTKPLAQFFQDPLLSAEMLQKLRRENMVYIVREEEEVLTIAVLMPISPRDVILGGVWVADEYEPELALTIASHAIAQARENNTTTIIPSALLAYVRGNVLTPKEAGRPLESILEAMTHAGIPRRHHYRNGGLKIVPPVTVVESRHAVAAQF